MRTENFSTTEIMFAEEYKKAIKEHKACLSSFNNANPEFIDIAIEQLSASELRLDALYKKAKLLDLDIKVFGYEPPNTIV